MYIWGESDYLFFVVYANKEYCNVLYIEGLIKFKIGEIELVVMVMWYMTLKRVYYTARGFILVVGRYILGFK